METGEYGKVREYTVHIDRNSKRRRVQRGRNTRGREMREKGRIMRGI